MTAQYDRDRLTVGLILMAIILIIVFLSSCSLIQAGGDADSEAESNVKAVTDIVDKSEQNIKAELIEQVTSLKQQISVVETSMTNIQNNMKVVQNSTWLIIGIFALMITKDIIIWRMEQREDREQRNG